MRLTVLLAALCVVLFAPSAEARPKHHFVDATNMVGCSDPIMRPCVVTTSTVRKFRTVQHTDPIHKFVQIREKPVIKRMGKGLHRVMAEGAGRISKPIRYIAGRLICARNVNSALAERGIRGTGSALALSFLHWGMPSAPVPGAVAVSARRGGGHVAIVSRVINGQVYVWNPSPRGRGWQEQPYRHHAIAYRVAGSQSVF